MSTTRTVLITGAGGNLGRAFTAVFAADGYCVAGIDNDKAALTRFSETAQAAGGDHLALACDLRDWNEIEQAVDAAARRFGRIDVVINNATARTTPNFKPIEECGAAELDTMFAVGPRAALGTMRAALPHLKQVRGKVINIGSGAGISPAEGLGAYAMSKAALQSLTRSAAMEWGKYGITVNGILPFAMTDKLASVLKDNPDIVTGMPPIGRIGNGEADIGAVALFLASPAASYITGQNIPVDGGLMLR